MFPDVSRTIPYTSVKVIEVAYPPSPLVDTVELDRTPLRAIARIFDVSKSTS